MKRIIELDIMKGIAIYLVVLGHLLNQIAKKDIILITFCHMPTFFGLVAIYCAKPYAVQRGYVKAFK